MAVLTSSMQTFVDLTDQRKLSSYITSNLPTVQTEDPNVLPHTYMPSWTTTALVITPVVYLDQTPVALTATGLTITWKRREGSGSETALTAGETASAGVLTVNQNKLPAAAGNQITYLCYVSYYDEDTKNTVNIVSDLTFSLIKNAENARLATVIADQQVFKYDKNSALSGPAQITLTGLVQGVTVSKWQYKKSDGTWADYPTTSDNANITGGTLVVKPAHAVFFGNTASIRLATSDADITDTVTLSKLYDGETGATGSAGPGGLSVVLGNEAQILAATAAGAVSPAAEITIPFYGYKGATRIAITCAVGTLPSGMTVKTNTAGSASATGNLVLAVANNATLGGGTAGVVDLTFTLDGKSIIKKFGWSKAIKGATGTAGANAILLTIYTPNGNVISNGEGSLLLQTAAYDGAAAITSGATYQWAKYTGGAWANISGATAANLTVQAADIVNIQSYRCTMTYKSKSYQAVVTVMDKSDPCVSEMLSIAGYQFKNGLGATAVYIVVRRGTEEIDPLKGPVSKTAPAAPKSGDFWWKVDTSAKTCTLMKYSGSAWAAATEKQSLTYTWHKRDKDGNAATFSKTGKVIFFDASEVDSLCSLQCDVSE